MKCDVPECPMSSSPQKGPSGKQRFPCKHLQVTWLPAIGCNRDWSDRSKTGSKEVALAEFEGKEEECRDSTHSANHIIVSGTTISYNNKIFNIAFKLVWMLQWEKDLSSNNEINIYLGELIKPMECAWELHHYGVLCAFIQSVTQDHSECYPMALSVSCVRWGEGQLHSVLKKTDKVKTYGNVIQHLLSTLLHINWDIWLSRIFL